MAHVLPNNCIYMLFQIKKKKKKREFEVYLFIFLISKVYLLLFTLSDAVQKAVEYYVLGSHRVSMSVNDSLSSLISNIGS